MFTLDKNKELGSGGFSTVYLGLFNMRQPVAIKKINLLNRSARSLEFFYNEIEIQRQLEHENVVSLFETKQEADTLYLVLELMISGSLYDFLDVKNIPLDSSVQLSITQDILSGLSHLHYKGFLHRDIKPENILFNQRMQAKIADFGLAINQIDATSAFLVGTKNYIAPELALAVLSKHKQYQHTVKTDVYALGITLLEMTLGTNAYFGIFDKLTWQAIADGRHHNIPQEPSILADVISICLTKNPPLRLDAQSVLRFLHILLDAAITIPEAVNGSFQLIHFAAYKGRLAIVEKLVKANPELVHATDEYNQTALLWAASEGNDYIVAFLIAHGADVNVATRLSAEDSVENHIYPLDWAIQGRHTNCISILMTAGAKENNRIKEHSWSSTRNPNVFFNHINTSSSDTAANEAYDRPKSPHLSLPGPAR